MANTYELVVSTHDLGGNFVSNTFHFQLAEAGTATPFEYADALITSWRLHNEAKYLDLLGNDVVVDFIQAKKITGGGGPSAVQIVVDTGTGADVSGPSGTAADIQWQTASGTNRPGHTFIGLFPFSMFKSGFYDNAYVAKVVSFVVQMQTALALAGALGNAVFGIFSRKTATFNEAQHGKLLPKPTMLNKRTLPQI